MSTERERAAEMREVREDYRTRLDDPAHLSGVTVDYTPLDKVPEIRLSFKSSGGPFLVTDYIIVGGPDQGKRIQILDWHGRRAFVGMADKFNGTEAEFERSYGYSARPALMHCGTLHISTVMYIRGRLRMSREYRMANYEKEMQLRHDREILEELGVPV